MKPPEYQHTTGNYWQQAYDRLEMIRFHRRATEPMRFQAELLLMEAWKRLQWNEMAISESEFMTAHQLILMDFMDFIEANPEKPNWRSHFRRFYRPLAKNVILKPNEELVFQDEANHPALRMVIYRRLHTLMHNWGNTSTLSSPATNQLINDIIRRVKTKDGSKLPFHKFEVLLEACPPWNLAYLLLGIGHPSLRKANQTYDNQVAPVVHELYQEVKGTATMHVQEMDVEVLAKLYVPEINQIRVMQETVAVLLDLTLDVLVDDASILVDRRGVPVAKVQDREKKRA